MAPEHRSPDCPGQWCPEWLHLSDFQEQLRCPHSSVLYEGAKHPTPLAQTPPFPLNPNPGPSRCSSSVCAWGSSRPMFTDLIFESDPGGPETRVQCLTEGERQELASSEWTRAQMGTGREGQCPVGCWSLSLAQNSRPLFKGRSGCSQGQGLNRPHQRLCLAGLH